MRNRAASQLLTNSFGGGDSAESVIHIRDYEENDESTAVSIALSSAKSKSIPYIQTSCKVFRSNRSARFE